MQIVYISNRPNELNETLEKTHKYMSFIDEAVVICPEHHLHSVKAPDNVSLKVISDDEIIGDRINDFPALDHQARNFLLRTRLLTHTILDDEFIMSDDDSRPIRTIPFSFFKEGNRYHNYFFYDLSYWTFYESDFDVGQRNTFSVLNYYGYPLLSYASHMPQIINKKIFVEAANFFKTAANNYPLCEWSIYFNYSQKNYGAMFHRPKPFRTLCWPEYPSTWPFFALPEEYMFENYCPGLYKKGRLFSDLPTAENQESELIVNLEKVIRWHRAEVGRSNFTLDPSDPWRYKSFWHKIAILILSPFRKLIRLALHEEISIIKRISYGQHHFSQDQCSKRY